MLHENDEDNNNNNNHDDDDDDIMLEEDLSTTTTTTPTTAINATHVAHSTHRHTSIAYNRQRLRNTFEQLHRTIFCKSKVFSDHHNNNNINNAADNFHHFPSHHHQNQNENENSSTSSLLELRSSHTAVPFIKACREDEFLITRAINLCVKAWGTTENLLGTNTPSNVAKQEKEKEEHKTSNQNQNQNNNSSSSSFSTSKILSAKITETTKLFGTHANQNTFLTSNSIGGGDESSSSPVLATTTLLTGGTSNTKSTLLSTTKAIKSLAITFVAACSVIFEKRELAKQLQQQQQKGEDEKILLLFPTIDDLIKLVSSACSSSTQNNNSNSNKSNNNNKRYNISFCSKKLMRRAIQMMGQLFNNNKEDENNEGEMEEAPQKENKQQQLHHRTLRRERNEDDDHHVHDNSSSINSVSSSSSSSVLLTSVLSQAQAIIQEILSHNDSKVDEGNFNKRKNINFEQQQSNLYTSSFGAKLFEALRRGGFEINCHNNVGDAPHPLSHLSSTCELLLSCFGSSDKNINNKSKSRKIGIMHPTLNTHSTIYLSVQEFSVLEISYIIVMTSIFLGSFPSSDPVVFVLPKNNEKGENQEQQEQEQLYYQTFQSSLQYLCSTKLEPTLRIEKLMPAIHFLLRHWKPVFAMQRCLSFKQKRVVIDVDLTTTTTRKKEEQEEKEEEKNNGNSNNNNILEDSRSSSSFSVSNFISQPWNLCQGGTRIVEENENKEEENRKNPKNKKNNSNKVTTTQRKKDRKKKKQDDDEELNFSTNANIDSDNVEEFLFSQLGNVSTEILNIKSPITEEEWDVLKF